ncbi:MAG: hypothetical protein L3J07_01630 [Candidatus Magasanikbacteria bacterium]|nr:hypothetical protein [Candidatus Magasanikbacteria bacterium]
MGYPNWTREEFERLLAALGENNARNLLEGKSLVSFTEKITYKINIIAPVEENRLSPNEIGKYLFKNVHKKKTS